jgi:hypothetical protein
VASNALVIENIPNTLNTSTSQRLKISGIEPNKLNRIFIPIDSQFNYESVKIVNPKQFKLDSKPIEGVSKPTNEALQNILYMSILWSIIFGIFTYWVNIQAEKRDVEFRKKYDEYKEESKNRLDEYKEEAKKMSEGFHSKLQENREEAKDLRNTLTRQKILLLARLSDYSKELSFWQDTVRKILYQQTGSGQSAEKLIEEVRNSLGTYTTKKGVEDDLNTVKVLADMLNSSSDKQSNKK